MMTLTAAWAVLRKDLRLNARSGSGLAAMFVFGAVILMTFSVGLEGRGVDPHTVFGSVLWSSFALASLLGLYRSFQLEDQAGSLPVLKLAQGATALFAGKWLANALCLALVELPLALLAEVFFRAELAAHAGAFLALAAAGTLGISAVGTLFAFVAGRSRLGELLLPALVLPLLFPLLMFCVGATEAMLTGEAALFGHHLRMIVGLDVIYAVAGWLLFEPLLESS